MLMYLFCSGLPIQRCPHMITAHQEVKYKYTVPTIAYVIITDFIRLLSHVKSTVMNVMCEIKMKLLLHGV